MVKLSSFHHTEDMNIVGHIFDAPIVVKGWTWLPLAELVTWAIVAWVAGKRNPECTWQQRLAVGLLTMPVILGSEWCHNLSHTAAAKAVGKPLDAMRVLWGMPVLIYYDVNDQSITPRQHIVRALGGPFINALFVIIAKQLHHKTRPSSLAYEITNTAVIINTFLCTASLLPIPYIDGGPILKWWLVINNRTPDEADHEVRQVNGITSIALTGASFTAFKKKHKFLGIILALFAALSLVVSLGWIKEQ